MILPDDHPHKLLLLNHGRYTSVEAVAKATDKDLLTVKVRTGFDEHGNPIINRLSKDDVKAIRVYHRKLERERQEAERTRDRQEAENAERQESREGD